MRWTRPFFFLGRAGERLLDRVLCVAGAVIFSQAPEFMQQYLQRLGGHLDEARRQLERLAAVATQSGLTVEQLTAHAAASADPAVARLGGVVRETSSRVDALVATEGALRQASLWTRPFVFFRHFDPAIARATWSAFRPAVPTTIEGLAYALVGMAAALAVYHLGVKVPVRHAWRARAAGNISANPPAPPGRAGGAGASPGREA